MFSKYILSKPWKPLIIVSAALVSGLAAYSAFAMPYQEMLTTYYSDAAKTKVVGSSWLTCYGFRVKGKRTNYYSAYEGRICGSGRTRDAEL
jgi:hypothetical protein